MKMEGTKNISISNVHHTEMKISFEIRNKKFAHLDFFMVSWNAMILKEILPLEWSWI